MRGITDYLFIIIMSLLIVVPLAFLRLKMTGFGTNKKIIKTVLITTLSTVLIFAMIEILDNNLPKYEVGVNINIHNKNDSFAAVNINGTYYYIDKDGTINIDNLSALSGFIAIKTSNNARIWLYSNKKSVFQSHKKVKIEIDNKKIKIKSFLLDYKTFVKNYEWYDAALDLLIKNRQNGINS
jgi:hypothetical protein